MDLGIWMTGRLIEPVLDDDLGVLGAIDGDQDPHDGVTGDGCERAGGGRRVGHRAHVSAPIIWLSS